MHWSWRQTLKKSQQTVSSTCKRHMRKKVSEAVDCLEGCATSVFHAANWQLTSNIYYSHPIPTGIKHLAEFQGHRHRSHHHLDAQPGRPGHTIKPNLNTANLGWKTCLLRNKFLTKKSILKLKSQGTDCDKSCCRTTICLSLWCWPCRYRLGAAFSGVELYRWSKKL